MRLIDADRLISELKTWDWQDCYLPIHFKDMIDDIPTVDASVIHWNSADEPPKAEGSYLVVLAHPEVIDNGESDETEWSEGMMAYDGVEARWFGRIDSWTMCDAPAGAKLWWSEQSGSSWHERVLAWAEMPEYELVKPKGENKK